MKNITNKQYYKHDYIVLSLFFLWATMIILHFVIKNRPVPDQVQSPPKEHLSYIMSRYDPSQIEYVYTINKNTNDVWSIHLKVKNNSDKTQYILLPKHWGPVMTDTNASFTVALFIKGDPDGARYFMSPKLIKING